MLKVGFYSQATSLLEAITSNHSDLNIFITLNDNESKLLSQELRLINNEIEITVFPSREVLPYDIFSSPPSIRHNRISILRNRNLLTGILLCPLQVLTELFQPKSFIDAGQILEKGNVISLQSLKKSLEVLGYTNVDKVSAPNEYAFRGGILDYFSYSHAHPIRIEFFGDQIESIRYFDPISQTRIEELSSAFIYDGEDVPLLEENIDHFINSWRSEFSKYDERECEPFQTISRRKLPQGFENYLPLFFNNDLASFFEIFDGAKYYVNELINTASINHLYQNILNRFDTTLDHKFPKLTPDKLFLSENKLSENLEKMDVVKNILNFHNIHEKNWVEVIASDSFLHSNLKLVTASLSSQKDESITLNRCSSFRPVFNDSTNTLFLHREFFKSNTFIETSSAKHDPVISNRVDLEEIQFEDGQLVIHEDYGLGICKGLDLLTLNAHSEECLKILFAEDEILYLPLRSLHKISKFPSNNDREISLDSLSSKKFSKKKESIKKEIYDSAVYFLESQAKRTLAHANRLLISDEEYQKFDEAFPFELTKDQQSCMNEIVHDLGLIKPMDRVICGDVGFGKTELAMRATFIAAYNNKQSLLVVPSTILCDQHLESFTERFANFPVSIEALSRRKSSKDRDKIIQDFNDHKIDILIGTHAIFNESINHNNVSLLVLDEEHRFGAKQKDLIKNQCNSMHILSMSATPIPRTMNQIFTGLKDFSYLYTPPLNRLSVHTYKHIESPNVLKTSIEREVSRSGQVFIVQNNIQKHTQLTKYLENLIPDAKVGSAHGKLKNDEIKSTMLAFKNGLIDVLICTTIVEMGIDIPNANTMIVIDAHKFGLAQLHQLRGRVGRSAKQGYCYFLIPTEETTKDSQARLSSLLNHSALGSGYFIAQEDMEIRGAGELLGEKQSGHIHTLGMSLYLSLLKDAVSTINNSNDVKAKYKVKLDFNDASFIPQTFLPSPNERLKYYQKLNEVLEIQEIEPIALALKDIGGKHPSELINLLDDHRLRIHCLNLGIKKVITVIKNIHIQFNDHISDSIYTKLIQPELRNKFSVKYLEDNKISIAHEDNARSIFNNFINSIN